MDFGRVGRLEEGEARVQQGGRQDARHRQEFGVEDVQIHERRHVHGRMFRPDGEQHRVGFEAQRGESLVALGGR